ncbi:MAG: LptF/LptG family permease [Candidatus Binatia bacterium]
MRWISICRVLFPKLCAPHRRFGNTLGSYIVQETCIPTFGALVGLTILLLAKDFLSFSDFVINRGIGITAVALIVGYEIVPLIARTLPFAVLLGVLVGFGRLRADREILAIEAAGVSSRRLLGPALAFSTAMMTIGVGLSLFASPWATRALSTALHQMTAENPGLALRAGTVHEFSGVKLVAREVTARGDQLRGVLLWIPAQGQTIFAERGSIIPQQEGIIHLVLYDGVMLRTPRLDGEETRFERFWQTLQEEPGHIQRNEEYLTGVSLADLVMLAWTNPKDRDLAQRAQLEFHRRLAYPVASLCFGLLAVPLALIGRRFSRATGGLTGLLVTLVYYGLMQLGDGLVQGGFVSVGAGVWLPNIVVSVCAMAVLWGEKLQPRPHQQTRCEEATAQSQPLRRFPLFQRYVLQRYVVRQYLSMLLLSFAVLLVGYLLVDVLERLEMFARYHADMLKALQFYSLRIPLLASRITPMAFLLATALTIGMLATQRELIGMRACGVCAARAVLPILLIAGLLAPVYFLLNEALVPHTAALADQFKNQEIKKRTMELGPLQQLIWYQAGTRVYQAVQLDPRLGEAEELSIYDLDANGLPVSRTDARTAKYLGDGVWELVDPVRIEISNQGLRKTQAAVHMQLGDTPTVPLNTLYLGVWSLAREIQDADANGYDTTAYKVDLQVKLAAPVACVLLPAIVLFMALSGPPFPSSAQVVLISSVLGISYILLTGISASLGYGGILLPILAGWVPSLCLSVLVGVSARQGWG